MDIELKKFHCSCGRVLDLHLFDASPERSFNLWGNQYISGESVNGYFYCNCIPDFDQKIYVTNEYSLVDSPKGIEIREYTTSDLSIDGRRLDKIVSDLTPCDECGWHGKIWAMVNGKKVLIRKR